MEMIKLIDGKPTPYSDAAFRRDNKRTVYGVTLSNSQLNAQDVYRVQTAPEPKEIGKFAVNDAMPVLTNGVWVHGWNLEVKDADGLRAERDSLIASTDWWALSDRTMTAEQTAYRQALRDITGQDGFPTNITWPTKPE